MVSVVMLLLWRRAGLTTVALGVAVSVVGLAGFAEPFVGVCGRVTGVDGVGWRKLGAWCWRPWRCG